MQKTSEKLNLYQIDLGQNLRLGREKSLWFGLSSGLFTVYYSLQSITAGSIRIAHVTTKPWSCQRNPHPSVSAKIKDIHQRVCLERSLIHAEEFCPGRSAVCVVKCWHYIAIGEQASYGRARNVLDPSTAPYDWDGGVHGHGLGLRQPGHDNHVYVVGSGNETHYFFDA